MSLNRELFDHLLFLTRLSVSPAEREDLITAFEHALTMINDMHRAPTEQVSPLEHPLSATLRLRADAITEQVDRDALQASAPATSEGLYLVPRVIE